MHEEKRGVDHPDLLEPLGGYLVLLRKLGRDKEAGELEQRANAIRAKYSKGDAAES
jgi:hypothetical protein